MPEIADTDMSWPVVDTAEEYAGSIVSIRRDTLRGSDGDTFQREVVSHKGAVGIVALDHEDRVLIVTQYRHPARQRLVELPAGLLDKSGRTPSRPPSASWPRRVTSRPTVGTCCWS